MKHAKILYSFVLVMFLAATARLHAQGTAFTYQGRLNANGAAANGSYDFRFKLFSDSLGNNQVGSSVLTNGLTVNTGLFTTTLDFGAGVFTGSNYWLLVGVRTNTGGTGLYTDLAPLQPITPVPYAIMANSASNLLGVLPTSKLSGTVANNQLANSAVNVTLGAGLGGTGSASLGGSLTLSNTGVISVTGNSDITANTVGGAVTLGDTGVSTATANTLVKRDGAGSFSAGNITAAGTFIGNGGGLTNVLTGQLTGGPANNYFYGRTVGNQAATGTFNVGAGVGALSNNSSGFFNSGYGAVALTKNTTGSANTAIGSLAMQTSTTGDYNTAVGTGAMSLNLSGSTNTAIGRDALAQNTSGSLNTAIGADALVELGGHNQAGGNNNIALGYQAGSAFAFNESGNIDIGNIGVLSENNIIRIGTPGVQTQTFIAGTLNGDGGGLTNLSTAQLVGSANTNIFIGQNAGNPTMTGFYNVGIGAGALSNNTSGYVNAAYGTLTLVSNTTGVGNIAMGVAALYANLTGSENTALGVGAMEDNAAGSNNLALGIFAIALGTNNCYNTAVGVSALQNLGTSSTAGGSNNIALGNMAGYALSGTESNNIEIGNIGNTGESNTIRIGTDGVQTKTFIAGVIHGDGSGLTGVSAANVTTGTLADSQLSDNVALLDANQIFTGANTFDTGAGTLSILNDSNVVPEIVAAGGLAPGHARFKNALEIWPDSTLQHGAILDLRSTNNPNIASISLTGNTGAIVCSNVTANGVLLTSDRNAKEHFTAINSRDVLAKVASLPMTEWNYKSDSSARHLGPMAQDFQAAFQLSADDTHISVVDEGGVALAAIQGLNAKLEEQKAENAELKQEMAQLKKLVAEIAAQKAVGK